MTTTITKRAIPAPQGDLKPSVQALYSSVNELSGAIGSAMQRAVRVCELVDAGILQLMPNGQLGRSETVDDIGTVEISDVTGLTTALNNRVLKAGDTMSGTLTISTPTNSRAFYTATTGGVTSTVGSVSTEAFIGTVTNHPLVLYQNNVARGSINISGQLTMSTVINANGGLRTFNAGQVQVFDNNNDTPVELGLGYATSTDRNAYLWNRNNGWLSFGTNGQERMRIQGGGNIVTTGGTFIVQNNDIYTYRVGGTTGVVFLNSGGTRYLFNDGSLYQMPGQGLNVGGNITSQGTIQSDTRAVTGLFSGEGFQIVWNTAQVGNGRTEFVNNRGGGGGGYTWWDRANTSAGLGSPLMTLTGSGLFVESLIRFANNAATVGQLSSHPVFGANYATIMGAGMGGQEYALLFSRAGVDNDTYISSVTTGRVRIRPSGNATTGEVIFSTTGVSFAVNCTAPNFTATSDERLKANIRQVPLNSELARLPLIDWNWINSGQAGRGVSAQSVQKVAPAYVYAHPETGMLSVDKAGLALEMAMLALAHLRGDRHAVPL